MKTSALKFCFIAVMLITALLASAQTKSTITIKSMTIQNGDTIAKEQTFQNDGNTMIYDSLFDNNSRFLFFNRNYDLDTNFKQGFSDIFGKEMNDFMKKFNFPSGNLMDPDFDFFGHDLNLDLDSAFSKLYHQKLFPDDSDAENPEEMPQLQTLLPYEISCEKLISIDQNEVAGYATEPDDREGNIKVSFTLDAQKESVICLYDAANKPFYKEKVPKSKGIYTRLFDFTVYEPGTYYVSVAQGKKISKSRIVFKKNGF